MRVVINGAGIAGAALAFWLGRAGHEVLLVERAPALRMGGYVLNLWGIGYDAVEKMGLLPQLLALQYQVEALCMVDERGRVRGGYPSRVLSRLTWGRIAALARADIAATLHAALAGRVTTRFGDSIAAIADEGECVRVHFGHASPCEADLVVGADGLHSRVRELVFGPEARFEHSLGCHVAAFEVAGYRPRDERRYEAHTAAGRYVAKFPVRDDTMLFFMVLRDACLAGAAPADDAACKAALTRAFADMGWECPGILAELRQAREIYFDSISQVRMPAWTQGRVALVGDAAACPSLIAGEGCGFALAEAYVLAGELQQHPADIGLALARYQSRMMPVVARKQQQAKALVSSFVPRTGFGVRVRDLATLLMRLPVFPKLLMGRYLSDEMTLPDYPQLRAAMGGAAIHATEEA